MLFMGSSNPAAFPPGRSRPPERPDCALQRGPGRSEPAQSAALGGGPQGVLELQRLIGNRAVQALVQRRPLVARQINPDAQIDSEVREVGTGAGYRVLKAFGGNAASRENSRQAMFLLSPVGGGQERIVHADDSRFVSVIGPLLPPAVVPGAAVGPAPAANPFGADGESDFTFEGWFQYFYEEVPPSLWAPFAQWATEYQQGQHRTDPERRATLESMFAQGFVEYDVAPTEMEALSPSLLERARGAIGLDAPPQQTGVTTATGLTPGPDLGLLAPNDPKRVRYQVNLPTLAGTSLGFRCDSRSWDLIQQQSGSKAQARVTAPPIRSGRNFDKAWNPFSDPRRQSRMYMRKGKLDNCLRTVVSVAMDLRDTVTFPKPKATMSGTDTVTIYVVYVPKVMDTSALALDLWNATRWERGETAAFEVPAQNHLMRLKVERYFDPAIASYVVGHVTEHEPLNKDRWAGLPPVAAGALQGLMQTLGGGALSWFEWGEASAAGGQRTQQVRDLARAAGGGNLAQLQDLYHDVVASWNHWNAKLLAVEMRIFARRFSMMDDCATITANARGVALGPPRGRVKDDLRFYYTRTNEVVNENGVAGLTAHMYDVYKNLYELNQAPQNQMDVAAIELAVADLRSRIRSAHDAIDMQLDKWDRLRRNLIQGGLLTNAQQWEAFVSGVLRAKVP